MLARLLELIEILATDMLVLDRQNARLLPFAERAELHIANDRLEARIVEMSGKFSLIEAAGRGYRFPQNLERGVGERSEEITECIDSGFRRSDRKSVV